MRSPKALTISQLYPDMTFTAGKRCAPTLVIIALVIIVAALVYLVTAKSHHYRPIAAPVDSR